VKRLESYLTNSKWNGWIDEERQSHLDALHKTLDRHAAAHRAEATAAAEADRAKPSAPAVALTPLAEPDQAIFLATDGQSQRGEWNEAFIAVTGLADRYPKFLAAQQKAASSACSSA
jgi:hypothetical protein